MKYLILGVNGMAGHIIAQYLIEQGHVVTGFARSQSPICRTIVGDAMRKEDLLKAINGESVDVVINCIGVLNKFVDENLADGIYLNSVLPHFLADVLKNTSTKLIHISTDCVFEGTRGNYIETDLPDAVSYYGRSKALGEVMDHKNLTFRTSIVGPELKADGIGLFHWFMQQKGTIQGFDHVIWSGVTTLQLAKAIEMDGKDPQTGLYHLVNNECISKYELLCLFQKYCSSPDEVTIEKNTEIRSNKSIINTREEKPFIVPSYEQMVQEMADWINRHSNLYKQYLKEGQI